jgi:putative oxidoreductase
MRAGRLIARVIDGGLFIGHGTQKLFGWFGGPGPEGFEKVTEKLELYPPRRNALAASLAETGGGAMLAAGALTPVAGGVLTGVMITAIRKVHFPNGFWNTNGGYEFNLALIAAIAALVDGGPGSLSVDHALGIDETGPAWALASLAGGAAASTLVIEMGRRNAQARQAVDSSTEAPVEPEPAAATT